jgi:hypothetical protein
MRIFLLLILLGACAGEGVTTAAPPRPEPAQERMRFKAVLVAGDDAQAVFDNGVARMAARLSAAGIQARRLAASDRAVAAGAAPATLSNVLGAIGAMRAARGEGCFVFITSHGVPRRGLVLARAKEVLGPAALDRALEQGCGSAPTVVVASGCYSGAFAAAPMARPNRIVLTAARPDRPSFGCGADSTYTYFDECFFDSLEISPNWQAAFSQTRECVGRREATLNERPSEPQGYFGTAVSGLPLPW